MPLIPKYRRTMPKFKFPKPDRPCRFKPGDAVWLRNDVSEKSNTSRGKEKGRVVYTWWDKNYGWWDCYVAFFGFRWPKEHEVLEEQPYVLRYFDTSLEPYDDY